MTQPVFIIAEAGVNHNGSLECAREMVAVAADAGACAIKYQTFRAESLATQTAELAEYQKASAEAGDSQFSMLKNLELSNADHLVLVEDCRKAGIEFMSTAFDPDCLRFLCEEAKIERIKIPSGEITNPVLLLAAGRAGLQIILSTGMADSKEIEEALGVLAFALADDGEKPSRRAFREAYSDPAKRSKLNDRVTILQCTTMYPTPPEEIHLRSMDTIARQFQLPVGLSDHSLGTAVAIGAAARGARIIEKHFTLDRTLPGPDQAASLQPDELKDMIDGIRTVEAALGSADKQGRRSEIENRRVARRGLYAARDIKEGATLEPEDIVALRPENSLSPMDFWDRVGQRVDKPIRRHEPLDG